MSKSTLGELEIMVLLAVMQAADGAYATRIAEQMRERADREVARGALYVTLERLVDKGYLDSTLGETVEGRGGRPRRYYEVTLSGRRALRDARDAMRSMWHGLEGALEDA